MDAFFASVEERDHKWLRGKPIVVGADPKDGEGRGVVSTANYKAREYGIHSALPISKAWQLCEVAKKEGKAQCFFVGGNFQKYGIVSENIMQVISRFSSKIEKASVDEAYFEFPSTWRPGRQVDFWEEAKVVAEKIKKEIKRKEKLTCSIGIGPNKLIAKIASDFKKPDGLTLVRGEEAEKFLEPMPIRKIPGIGPKTEKVFLKKGIKIVSDLKKFSRKELPHFYDAIRGIGNSELEEAREVKSISEENTFEVDTLDPNILLPALDHLSRGVFESFKSSGFATFGNVSIKIRFSNFETKTRAHTLNAPKRDLSSINKEVLKLFLPFLDRRENPDHKRIRLVGVKIEKLGY